jgi:MOSC domain-containing protein YiiM
MPRRFTWIEREVVTGIFKESVGGRLKVRTLGVDGDGQVDLTVHGGIAKAVYAYPSEHYEY